MNDRDTACTVHRTEILLILMSDKSYSLSGALAFAPAASPDVVDGQIPPAAAAAQEIV
jgi:hypothetical protein